MGWKHVELYYVLVTRSWDINEAVIWWMFYSTEWIFNEVTRIIREK
jgi:hypothetical protein